MSPRIWTSLAALSALAALASTNAQESFFYAHTVDFNNPEFPNDEAQCIRNSVTSEVFCELSLTTAQTYPDGVSKLSYAINGFTPGPSIHCLYGDKLYINATNHFETETTSLHWHGLLQRNNSVWMDGVSYVTQFPMPPMVAYSYTVEATEQGTQWYHSHAGPQYADGLFGALIIHDPDDPYASVPEFTVLMNEWQHKSGAQIVTDLGEGVYNDYFPTWVSGLINGNGRYACSEDCGLPTCIPNHNYSVFMVSPNETYRFRVIGSTAGSTLIFGIDNHSLTVVAVDGVNIEPVVVDRVYVYFGPTI
jgi:iron transport multicopper oxidase